MNDVEDAKEINLRLNQELEQARFELSLLYDISNRIGYSLDYNDLMVLLTESLHKIIKYDVFSSLILIDEGRKIKISIYAVSPVSKKDIEEIKLKLLKVMGNLGGMGLLADNPVLLEIKGDVRDDIQSVRPIKASFDVPLFAQNRAVGILNVASFNDINYSDDNIKLLYTLATQASATIERLQAVLAGEKSKMKIMVERMSEGVILLNEKDEAVIFNTAAAQMLKMGRQELTTANLIEALRGFEVNASLEEIKNSAVYPWVKDLCIHGEDSRIIHLEAVFIKDVQERPLGISLVLRDVTKEREIDQMKNEFVSLVSHELRTPLAAMKAATENMFDGLTGALNPTQTDCVVLIKRNIQRLSRLISDLLDIARIESGKLEMHKQAVDLRVVIGDMLALLRLPAQDKSITLSAKVDEQLPGVDADSDKITQVLTNLVGNALKFTPAGGAISVGAVRDGQWVKVGVSDTGIGIPSQALDKVFDKFYQVAGVDQQMKVKGTGLGLPISKGIIEKHGGKMWVESEINKGSTFYFTLPVFAAGS